VLRTVIAVSLAALLAPVGAFAQGRPGGDMDALLGPATLVNQGEGMTDEIQQALAAGPHHAVLRPLVGEWALRERSETGWGPVAGQVVVTELLSGAWFEMRVYSGDALRRVVHLGYDGYRGTYVMWEVGSGFTSPQIRAGHAVGSAVEFWRAYTIRRRGELVQLREEATLSFESDGSIGWRVVEALGDGPPRVIRDARLGR